MKKALVTLILISLTVSANAIVADKFKCSVEINEFNSNMISKQEKEFFVARVPFSQNQPTDIQFTIGKTLERMTLATPQATLGVNLNFYYKHAVRSNSNGQLEARQFICIGQTTDYCRHSTGNGFVACSSANVACKEPSDPFDQNLGWSPTTVFGSVPTFNEQELGRISTAIKDDHGNMIGVASSTCQLLGTFY